ncbi:MAG: hypothetical protein CMF69_12405 [Magnetovibrio sp.]|nr:hypothetical protein [Magnetovibrio sp.]|tara:strand:- start:1104 stop:1448 length:345 start_codon:yes stop_codon:yes gene_type:complete
MGYSVEFKRAIAIASISQLIQGRRNIDSATRHVVGRIGHLVFVTLEGERKIKALRDYRKRVLDIPEGKALPPRMSIARFHYDNCLKWVAEKKIKPEESAELLMAALLSIDDKAL